MGVPGAAPWATSSPSLDNEIGMRCTACRSCSQQTGPSSGCKAVILMLPWMSHKQHLAGSGLGSELPLPYKCALLQGSLRPLCGIAWAPDSKAVLVADKGSRQLVALYFTQQPPGLEAQTFPVSLPDNGAPWPSQQHIKQRGCEASPRLSMGLPCQRCRTCSCCNADAQDA